MAATLVAMHGEEATFDEAVTPPAPARLAFSHDEAPSFDASDAPPLPGDGAGPEHSRARAASWPTRPPAVTFEQSPLERTRGLASCQSLSSSGTSDLDLDGLSLGFSGAHGGGGLTSLRRSCSRLQATTSSAVLVLDANPRRRADAVDALRAAASAVGAGVDVDGVADGRACRARLEHLAANGARARLVVASADAVGAAVAAVADLDAAPAVVAVEQPGAAPRPRTATRHVGGPVGETLANELLWAHVLPHGPCPVAATRPVSSALAIAPGVGASLRAGGLRGLLALLHAERRRRGSALDRLLDGGGPGRRRTPCVLVVDDSSVARALHARALTRALAALGADGEVAIEVAADGVEACALFNDDVKNRARCVVLCLLDLAMPNMGGCAAARRLRAAGATAPIVAVTAAALPRGAPGTEGYESDGDDDDDAVALAFDDVITKPFTRADAGAVVEKWVLPRLHRKRHGSVDDGNETEAPGDEDDAAAPAPAKRRR